jgi:hypothetical protein
MTDYLEIARRALRGLPDSPNPSWTSARAPTKPDERNEPKGVPWAEWKAMTLNRLFQEQGVTGEPGHITAATVLHGATQVQRSLKLEKNCKLGQNVHRGS